MDNLELIDSVIDAKHRSHLVDGQRPPVLRLRTHDECWRLDARSIPYGNLVAYLFTISMYTLNCTLFVNFQVVD